MTERIRPFANDTEFCNWKRRNCEACTLRWQAGQSYRCDLECALDYAYGDNGMVTETIAKRLRFDGLYVAKDCPERVPNPPSWLRHECRREVEGSDLDTSR